MTKADFYIGIGRDAIWLGSVSHDGGRWAEEPECELMSITTLEGFVEIIGTIAASDKGWKWVVNGWPWDWESSADTDYVYYFNNGKVHCDDRDDWPDYRT